MKTNIAKYIKGSRLAITALLIMTLASTAASMLFPQLISAYIEKMENIGGGYITILTAITAAFFATLLLKMVFDAVNTYISQRIGWKATRALRADLLNHVVHLDLQFHKSHNSGELIDRIDGDANKLSKFFSEFIVYFIGNFFLLLGIIIYFFFQSVFLGLAFTGLAVVVLMILLKFQADNSTLWVASREAETKQYGFIDEHLKAKVDIKGLGIQSYVSEKLSAVIKDFSHKNTRANFFGNIPSTIAYSLMSVGEAIGIGIGAYMFLKGYISIGTIYVFTSYATLVNIPMMVLREEFINLQEIMAARKRVDALFSIKSSIPWGKAVLDDKDAHGIQISKLTYAYVPGVDVLKEIEMDIKPGTIVGLIGRTGSGKSTLLQLISKLYPVNDGTIFWGGVDINQFAENNFYQNISYVTQDIDILTDTVRANISLYNDKISDEDILKALSDCGLDSWFGKMDGGLDTIINKQLVSAGEGQLISLARSLLRNSKLLLFDEITSYMDEKVEALIIDALKKSAVGKTVIIVAHKPKILEMTDEIIALEDGKVVDFGSKESIMRKQLGRFFNEE